MVKDYSKTKLYKLVNGKTNDIYVGATLKTLGVRFSKHKYDAVRHPNRPVYVKLNEIGWEFISIVLIENYDTCTNRIEMGERERYWYDRLNPNLNKNVPGRSIAEYRVDNSDMIKLKDKKYRDSHKAQKKAYQLQYRLKNKEKNKAYRLKNKAKNRAYQKKWRDTHKVERKAYRQANKDKKNVYNKKYSVDNKDKLTAYAKEYYAKNKKPRKKIDPAKDKRRKAYIKKYYDDKFKEYMFED